MRLFISYRRADTQLVAGRMKTYLDRVPGIRNVFLDFDEIAAGEDFEHRILRALAKCSHCLVIIGRDWAGIGVDVAARIFDQGDFVRREVELALASKAKVIPILVDGAPIPAPLQLPPELEALSRINAFQLRSSHFNADMEQLLKVLFGGKLPTTLTAIGIAVRLFSGLVAGAIAVVAIAFVSRLTAAPNQCGTLACRIRDFLGLQDQGQALGPMLFAITLTMVMFVAAPFLLRILRRRK